MATRLSRNIYCNIIIVWFIQLVARSVLKDLGRYQAVISCSLHV